MDHADRVRSCALLREVFVADPRYRSAEYLDWLYAPRGAATVHQANEDDDVRRLGHYVVIPQTWSSPDQPSVPLALSLNTAVHPLAQGRGLFTKLAEQAFGAATDAGTAGVIGVANANSTPGFVRRLGFRLVSQLPAQVLLPRPGRALPRSQVFGPGLAAGPEWPELTRGLDRPALDGWRQVWTPDSLARRLSAPGRQFVLHDDATALSVSTVTAVGGVRVAALLAVFPRTGIAVSGARHVTAACLHHRAPVAVHAGWNPGVHLVGVPVPERFRPSPLNFIIRSLDADRVDQDAFTLERLEFLDFDAY